ncbi:MAG TPA: DegT/DnrJ/EryC1/StrS family aminotransferase [Solirubrobacteraceae bacterium]|nr:DegT/DnrJ/EryC1/StrS family aminotransferase [Solirubrobacteraceae bacterium]
MAIPLFDTETPLAPLRPRIVERVAEVIGAGRYVLGPEVAAFEAEFAAYLGVAHVVGVANGTDALAIALRALGVRAGDDVIVPALTFYATSEAVAAIGARPVFCDVDPDTRNVTVPTVRAALTPATTAIVAVDLFGVPAPCAELRSELGLPVLEDAAQAAGSRAGERMAGSLGDAATFSFYPSKNLPCFGDGGVVATDDAEVAALARALRFHGSRDKETFEYVGYNSRLDEIQAAILRVLLPELDGWADGRRAAGRAYLEAGIAEYASVAVPPAGTDPAWHLFVVTHPRADEALAALAAAGIQARGYYRTPLHRQPAMARFAEGSPVGPAELPVTDQLAATNIALPISPVLGAEQAAEVVAALAGA